MTNIGMIFPNSANINIRDTWQTWHKQQATFHDTKHAVDQRVLGSSRCQLVNNSLQTQENQQVNNNWLLQTLIKL